jgi:hypothetical protein
MPYDNPHEVPFTDIDILIDTRSHISNPNTWVKSAFKHGNRHCLVAALSLASANRHFNKPNEIERRLVRVLARQLPQNSPLLARLPLFEARQRLMWFNDSWRTTHADVLGVLDRAIEHLANEVPSYASA